MQTLYCPHCGYNLTGLPGNRCPECGRVFDPTALQLRMEAQGNKVSIPQVLKHLLPLPILFSISVLTLIIDDQVGTFLAVSCGIILLFLAPVSAYRLTRKLESARPRVQPNGLPIPPTAAFFPICFLGLTCCQYALAFGGCVAAVVMSL